MELTIEELKELAKKDSNSAIKENSMLDNCMAGKYCIVRTYSAGVHCGYISAHTDRQVLLKKARRIWSWEGAFTLSKIAKNCFLTAKMSVALEKILLLNAIEIIPTESAVEEKLVTWKTHNE